MHKKEGNLVHNSSNDDKDMGTKSHTGMEKKRKNDNEIIEKFADKSTPKKKKLILSNSKQACDSNNLITNQKNKKIENNDNSSRRSAELDSSVHYGKEKALIHSNNCNKISIEDLLHFQTFMLKCLDQRIIRIIGKLEKLSENFHFE